MDVFWNGFISGSVQSIVGHPLDTLKTRLQSGKSFSYGNLYQGFFPSLVCGCFQNGFLFLIEKECSQQNKMVSGFISGVLTSIIVCPLEQWKCRVQTGMFPSEITSWKTGLNWTIARDSIGFSSYFYLYEKGKNDLNLSPFWAGGWAGMVSWILSYPLDVKKTQVQLHVKSCASNPFCLWGMSIVSLRAFLVNGGIFYTFDKLSHL